MRNIINLVKELEQVVNISVSGVSYTILPLSLNCSLFFPLVLSSGSTSLGTMCWLALDSGCLKALVK